jgi:hypothetical protein
MSGCDLSFLWFLWSRFVPLITTYVGLIQVEHADFIRQTTSNHVKTWNLDGDWGST